MQGGAGWRERESKKHAKIGQTVTRETDFAGQRRSLLENSVVEHCVSVTQVHYSHEYLHWKSFADTRMVS